MFEKQALEAVLDASGAAAFALPDEKHHAAADACLAALQMQGAQLIAPPLFESEFDGILRRRVFLGTLTPQNAVAALRVVDALQVAIIYDPATRAAARSIGEALNRLRVYDATYAALAQGRGCDFWTDDERFYNAATDEGKGGAFPFVRFIGLPASGAHPPQAQSTPDE
jgi:predicted nucleic acid-binding protein